MTVFQQYIEVVTQDRSFKDLDMDVIVTMEKSGKLKFEASIWNMTEDSWATIQKDDIVQIKAGWKGGPVEVVAYGKINSKNKAADGNDIEFTIKGKDQTSSAMNARISKTWDNKDPADIAADIARQVGLSPQVVTVGDPIQGYWTATRDKQAKKWMDDLVTIAGEKTGTEWEWTGEEAELVFQPKDGTYREAPILSWDMNLVSLGKKESSGSSNEGEAVEFEAMLVPGIRKGSAVDVKAGSEFTDIWKVKSYEHQHTNDGEHLTSGVLIPTSQEYPVEAQRAINTEQRALDQLGF